jgi:hypothetical protein
MTIYLGRDGSFYGGFDCEFGRIGSNMEEVIDGLLNCDPPTRLDMVVPN